MRRLLIVRLSLLPFVIVLAFVASLPAAASGLLEPGCTPDDVAGPAVANQTCGGPVANPSGVYLFSGEVFHTAVDLRIRGRGIDFVWARTYRSRVGPRVGLGNGWDHSYDIRLTEIADGPSEARQVLAAADKTTFDWIPPANPAGDPADLRYCTLRSTDPSNFSGPGTTILDPEEADTTTADPAVPLGGQLFAYLILPKNRTRAGSLGTDSGGTERAGVTCGLTGPEFVLHDGTGREDTYLLQPDGSWTAPEFFRVLTEDPGQGFTLTLRDTDRWDFNPIDGSPAQGRIAAIVDRNDNTISFTYDAFGRLSSMTDTLGHVITVAYDAIGLIGSVTDHTGRQVSYEYYSAPPGGSFADLRSVTGPAVVGTPNGNDFPGGKKTLYTYSTGFLDPNLNHNLLTIADPKGQIFLQNVYSPTTNPAAPDYDRVVSQVWGGPGDILGYSYLPVFPTPANGFAELLTIENDRVGNVTEYFYDAQNRNVLRREYTGRAPDPDAVTTDLINRPVAPLRATDPPWFETRWAYNSESLAEQVVLPNGSDIQLVYDLGNPERRSQGNTTSRCRNAGPVGGPPSQICETFEYDDGPGGTNFVTRHVDGRGNPTTYTYDANGNRTQIVHRIPSIVEDFEYNGFGQMTSHTLPDNGSGSRRKDEFHYFTAGVQAGYRSDAVIDSTGLALPTSYSYDARGNVVSIVDPKGHDTQLVYNQLDQVVREISRDLGGGVGRYETDFYYDADNNLVRVDRLNVDDTGVVGANTHLTTIHEYDVLDNLIRTCREARDYSGPIPGTPTQPLCTGLPSGVFVFEEYAYDANRNRVLVRKGEAVNGNDPGNVVTSLYDERDLPFREVRGPGSPAQSTSECDYDLNANTQTCRQGKDLGTPRVFLFAYDGYDRLIRTQDPMGNVETFEYDANHNRVHDVIQGELVDVPGDASNLRLFEGATSFDAMDRIEERVVEHFDLATQLPILDGQSTTQLTWSGSSHLLEHTDDRGNTTHLTYDSANRLATSTDALGNRLALAYDANSNVTSRTSLEVPAAGGPTETYATTYDYDALDRLVRQTDNVGNVRRRAYDSRDNPILEFDALTGGVPGGTGNRTRSHYDGVNRLVRRVHTMTSNGTGGGLPVGTITLEQQWDDSHRLVAQIDDAGNATRYTYDALDRRIQTVFQDGTGQSMSYDPHDAPISRLDANGTATTIGRDLDNRILSRTIAAGPGVQGTTFEHFKHDGMSRVVLAEDDDSQVQLRYDSLGRVTEETQNGQTVRCRYDGMGNLLETVYPGGRTIGRSYDALNRVETVFEGITPIAEFNWLGPTRVARRKYGNGTQLDYSYDGILNAAGDFGVKKIIRTLHSGPGGLLDARAYTWDPMYDKTRSQDIAPGGNQPGTDYAYDSRYRLVRSSRFDATGPLGSTQYDLDGVTNRLAVVGAPDPGPYVMDPTTPEPADLQLNQYTSTSFDTRRYDKNGNLVALNPALPTERRASYDYADQMVAYDNPGVGTQARYEYDAFGRRIARTITNAGGPSTTRYFYQGWQVCEERDGAGATQATYVYGNDIDEVLSMRRGGADFYYHGDDLFSVLAVTSAAGNVVERYRYADYGDPTVLNAAGMPIPGTAIGNPYLFTGRRYDPETKWYYLRSRYLDPRAGRFTTRDSRGLWGDTSSMGNGATYAGGNPATWRDPFGEMIFVKIPNMGDKSVPATTGGRKDDWFIADSFSFGVEREMKESGEKGGTEDINIGIGEITLGDSFGFGVEREMKESGEKGGTADINIGVGELQECTISKSMDWASPKLAQFAINGNSPGNAEINFVEVAGGGAETTKPMTYLKYKLDRCFIKSWSVSGDADDRPTEEVAFYYNKIAFGYASSLRGGRGSPYSSILGYQSVPACSGDADDRPTEEVAFYFNKIAFGQATGGRGGGSSDRPMESAAEQYNNVGAGNWFTADSFGFGVEREMKESGEKGGTEDINIGIPELQE